MRNSNQQLHPVVENGIFRFPPRRIGPPAAPQQLVQPTIESDQEIETALAKIESDTNQDPPAPTNPKKGRGKNMIQANLREEAYRCYGVDLMSIDGVSTGVLSVLMSEIGNAKDLLNSFKSAKAFSSWLGLCPDNRISGGKILSSNGLIYEVSLTKANIGSSVEFVTSIGNSIFFF